MTDSEKFITILLAGGVALFATIFCTDSSAKMRRVAGKLDVAIDDLSDKNEVELEKCVIEKAVQKSVERKVNDIVGSASKYAIDRVADVMTDKVKSEVDASYTDIRKSVSRRVDQEIKDYDVDGMFRQVKKEAVANILEKFEDKIMDDVKDAIIDNIGKIHKNTDDILGRSGEQTVQFIVKKPRTKQIVYI